MSFNKEILYQQEKKEKKREMVLWKELLKGNDFFLSLLKGNKCAILQIASHSERWGRLISKDS